MPIHFFPYPSLAQEGHSDHLPPLPPFSWLLQRDGCDVAFSSAAHNLIAGEINDLFDFFLRDLTTGTTTRVSIATNIAALDHTNSLVDTSAVSSSLSTQST
jgi:hypothetical protein